MRLKRVVKFTSSVTKGLLPTQQATLAQMVCGLLCCRSFILAEIASAFETKVAFPHNLNRVERYVSNPRITALQSKQVHCAPLAAPTPSPLADQTDTAAGDHP